MQKCVTNPYYFSKCEWYPIKSPRKWAVTPLNANQPPVTLCLRPVLNLIFWYQMFFASSNKVVPRAKFCLEIILNLISFRICEQSLNNILITQWLSNFNFWLRRYWTSQKNNKNVCWIFLLCNTKYDFWKKRGGQLWTVTKMSLI